jgi:hypothetical protein
MRKESLAAPREAFRAFIVRLFSFVARLLSPCFQANRSASSSPSMRTFVVLVAAASCAVSSSAFTVRHNHFLHGLRTTAHPEPSVDSTDLALRGAARLERPIAPRTLMATRCVRPQSYLPS